MDSKTKLYVFAKKEVALIFVFMILIAITSFVLGVKIGKNYSLEMAGITSEDQKKVVELLSQKEESLEDVKKDPKASKIENSEIENKLKEKINEEFGTKNSSGAPAGTDAGKSSHETSALYEETSKSKDSLSGKFTIQLGSHRTLKEAEMFAEGFRARGYNPIINEIEIKNKGTWFRVSLEAFDSMEEAKAYVNREKTLFVGQDYTILKMP